MNHKKIVGIIFGVAVLLTVVGIVSDPSSFGLGCENNGFLCKNPFVFIRGEFYFALSIPLLLITPILFFVRRETFMLWAKFAGIAFPIMLGILLYTFNNAPTPGGFGLAGLIPDEQLASAILPSLFILISIILIAVKSWKLRGKN